MSVTINPQFEIVGEEIGLDIAEMIATSGRALIEAGEGPFQVNLAGLERANSVTVALLLAWYRFAMLQKKSIFFVNLSEELHNIIEFSGLSKVLLHRSPGT